LYIEFFISAKMQACGPEVMALRGKSIGGKRITSGGPNRASAGCGGPIGRPYIGTTLFLGKESLARPAQEMIAASWFLRATPLLSGQAMPKTQSILPLLAEN
jgi:hypothetical protein